MKLSTAKNILAKNGILWSHYFDLNFIEHNIQQHEGKENIIQAIKRVKQFITIGK